MRVLVTGSEGFLAARLIRALRAVRSPRAAALGLEADETIDDIVRRYRDDPEGLQIP